MTTFRYSSHFDCSPEALFAFHQDVRNLARISGGFPKVRVPNHGRPSQLGDQQGIVLEAGPLKIRWDAEVTKLDPPRLIEDTQIAGPFRRWRHQHRVTPDGDGARLTDAVAFRLLPTPVGAFIEYFTVRPALTLMFRMRHAQTRKLLAEESSQDRTPLAGSINGASGVHPE